MPRSPPGNLHADQSARTMADNLQTALQNRAVIDQAKGILMERYKMTADQAFQVLAGVDVHHRKLRSVADDLVGTGEPCLRRARGHRGADPAPGTTESPRVRCPWRLTCSRGGFRGSCRGQVPPFQYGGRRGRRAAGAGATAMPPATAPDRGPSADCPEGATRALQSA